MLLSAIEDLPGVDGAVFIINAPVVTFISALLIPLINGLLTKYTLSSNVKTFITIVLNAVVALFAANARDDGSALFTTSTIASFALATTISLLTYAKVYKPVGLTSSTPDGKLAPQFGLG